jgi:hypothetical protein
MVSRGLNSLAGAGGLNLILTPARSQTCLAVTRVLVAGGYGGQKYLRRSDVQPPRVLTEERLGLRRDVIGVDHQDRDEFDAAGGGSDGRMLPVDHDEALAGLDHDRRLVGGP